MPSPRIVPTGILAGRTGPKGPEGPDGPRGPAGYNATGAAQDQQAIADYVAATAGPNPVSTALSASIAAAIPAAGATVFAPNLDHPTTGVKQLSIGTSYSNAYAQALADKLGNTLTNKAQGSSNTPSYPAQYEAELAAQDYAVMTLDAVGEVLGEDPTRYLQSRRMYESNVKAALRRFFATAVRTRSHVSINKGDFTEVDFSNGPVPIAGLRTSTDGGVMSIQPAVSEVALRFVAHALVFEDGENADFSIRTFRGGVAGPWRAFTTKGMGDPRPLGGNTTYTLMTVRLTDLSTAPGDVIQIRKDAGQKLTFADYLELGPATSPKTAELILNPRLSLPGRVNLDPNPNCKVDTTGWSSAGTGNTMARSTAQVRSGIASLLVTWGTSTNPLVRKTGRAVTAGKTYMWSVWVYVPAGSAGCRVYVDGSGVAAQTNSPFSTTTNGWQNLFVSFTATATSTVNTAVQVGGASLSGQQVYIADCLFEEGVPVFDGNPQPLPFFDGDSVDDDHTTYDWTGTPGLSTSTARGDRWWFPQVSTIANGPMKNDATANVYRDILRRIATSGEFAGRVVYSDPAPLFDTTLHLGDDRIHPNAAGRAVIVADAAEQLMTAARH